MTLLSSLKARFARSDDRAGVRPLWHRTVELARDPAWYAEAGIADSVGGRFDAITLVLTAVLLRMEREPALIEPSVRLTELFVEDMDGQLRNGGVGDLVVGKHIGKLMSTLGGRLGAVRDGLAESDPATLEAAVTRNVTLAEAAPADAAARIARRLRAFAATLAEVPADDLLAARIALP